jgi:hypothetical protein
MIHQNIKELAEECDEAITKFISLNIPITDTENKHSLMVFILIRKGYKLHAQSGTRMIRSCEAELDDCFHLDEIFQDLHAKCCEAINNSKRYEVKHE